MYSRILFFVAVVVGFTSCSSDSEPTEELVSYTETEVPKEDTFPYDSLAGIYSGEFGGSNIRIVINYISAKNAVGYNIHLGLQRNISGKVERSGDTTRVFLAEPGDHPYDGVFQLTFIGEEDTPEGVWKSNNGKISEKKFTLKKYVPHTGKDFDYSDRVTLENFCLFFSSAYDTIGDYSFQEDGLVTFVYYPGGREEVDYERRGGARVEQSKTVLGNWNIEGEKVTLSWADNVVFPKQKMVYFVKRKEYDIFLDREENPIRVLMYP